MAEETVGNNNPTPATLDTNRLANVSQLKSASDLVAKLEQTRRARSRIEREWKLNMAFYKGNQWVFYNRFSGRIESLPMDDGDKPRYRVRLVDNKIIPGVQAYVAMLTKTKPVIYATPDSGSDRDIKAAQMAERLYEFWWQDFTLKNRLDEALTWATITGGGYWKLSWDPQAGTPMNITVNPQDHTPIMNPQLVDSFKDNLQRQGLKPDMFDRTIYMGDIRVDVLSPFNVYLDPTADNFEDAKWAICKHPMTPEEIKSRYGFVTTPDAVPTDPEVGLPFMNSEQRAEPSVKNVYIGYFKPTASLPKGRVVAFLENPKKILKDEAWSAYFPTNDLPLVKFPGIPVPGSTIDEALVTHARPIQKDYNRTLSQIVEFKNLVVKPQMIAPAGSLRQRLTNEPGAVFEYNPINNLMPEWRDMPSLPPFMFEHLQGLQASLDRLFNLQAITRGDVPPNVEAGVAIDLLQEAAVDQISPIIQRMEVALSRAGHLMVALAQKYYTEPRLLKIKGDGGSVQVKKFMNSDLNGSYSFNAEAGSGLPRTRAGRLSRIEQLVQMQILRPDQAAKYADVGDIKGLQAMMAADEDQAYREHEKIETGMPINPLAQQTAIQAVQSGMDPQTNQPLTGQENIQQLVHQAGLQPLPWENFQQHLDTHSLYMKSTEFEALPSPIQQDFETHFMQTLQYWRSLPVLPEPQAARTTMQLKGTIDPVTAAEVLKRSGVIDADPHNLAQPPLDTWVTDDQSKTGTDSGNVHLDAAAKMQDMQQAQDKHTLDTMKSVHQMSLAQQKASHDHQMNEQKMAHDQMVASMQQRHAEQLHNMKLHQNAEKQAQSTEHADEMHRVKKTATKKAANKPKPTSKGK